MSKKLIALYGLKCNPFTPDIPLEVLHVTPRIENFAWRLEQLGQKGGLAAVLGEPGLGKAATLCILGVHLARLNDVPTANTSTKEPSQ